MNTFSNYNTESNQSESTALLNTPGAATIKAFSIVINSLLQPQLLADEVKTEKKFTPAPANNNASTTATEAQPETSLVVSKAQGMVNHLKHTHSSGGLN